MENKGLKQDNDHDDSSLLHIIFLCRHNIIILPLNSPSAAILLKMLMIPRSLI